MIIKNNKNSCFRYKKRYRKYKLNENYFKRIDSHEKAYILGMLYADGCVRCKNKLKEPTTVILTLHDNDKYMLEKIAKILGSEAPIVKVKNKKCSVLTFNSKKLASDLVKLGCVPAKSLILKFPTTKQVPYKFLPSFLLGNFDGDGCISHRKSAQHFDVQFFGAVHLIKGIRNYFKKLGIKTTRLRKYDNPYIQQLTYDNAEDARKFFSIFYHKDSKIFLQRKYDRFLENEKLRKVMDFKHNPAKIIKGIIHKYCYCCKDFKVLDCFTNCFKNITPFQKHRFCKECRRNTERPNSKRRACGV